MCEISNNNDKGPLFKCRLFSNNNWNLKHTRYGVITSSNLSFTRWYYVTGEISYNSMLNCDNWEYLVFTHFNNTIFYLRCKFFIIGKHLKHKPTPQIKCTFYFTAKNSLFITMMLSKRILYGVKCKALFLSFSFCVCSYKSCV